MTWAEKTISFADIKKYLQEAKSKIEKDKAHFLKLKDESDRGLRQLTTEDWQFVMSTFHLGTPLSQDCWDELPDFSHVSFIEPAVYEEVMNYFENEFLKIIKVRRGWVYNDWSLVLSDSNRRPIVVRIEKNILEKIKIAEDVIEEINREMARRMFKANLIMNIGGLPIETRLRTVKLFYASFEEEEEIKNLPRFVDEKKHNEVKREKLREVLFKHSQVALIRTIKELNELIWTFKSKIINFNIYTINDEINENRFQHLRKFANSLQEILMKNYEDYLLENQHEEKQYYDAWITEAERSNQEWESIRKKKQAEEQEKEKDEGYHSSKEDNPPSEEPQETPPITPPTLPKPQLPNNNSSLKQLIQTSQTKIKSLLVKYHLKVQQLDKKFWNWEEQLAKLTSEEEINNYLQELEREISQVAQQQTVNKKESNSEPYPLWFWLVSGVMIISWVFWMRWIWRGKKNSTN